MFNKEVILGNFIKKNKILSYLEFIHNVYHIKYDNIFVYDIENNDAEYMATFKVSVNNKEIVKDIKGSHIFHFKQNCLFSINALNKMKEQNSEEVKWEKYTNKLVLITNNVLNIKEIKKIEDKCIFFK